VVARRVMQEDAGEEKEEEKPRAVRHCGSGTNHLGGCLNWNT
jgi:hypothetical protein